MNLNSKQLFNCTENLSLRDLLFNQVILVLLLNISQHHVVHPLFPDLLLHLLGNVVLPLLVDFCFLPKLVLLVLHLLKLGLSSLIRNLL